MHIAFSPKMYFCFSVDYAFVSRIALHQYFLNSQEDSHVNSFAFVFPFQKFCVVLALNWL